MCLNFLIEIGVEELPISEVIDILKNINELYQSFFIDNKISFGKIFTTGTPRRIVTVIECASENSDDEVKKIFGPPTHIFFDKNEELTIAGEKFLTNNDVKLDDVKFEYKDKKKKIKYAFLEKIIKGQSTKKLLQNYFPELLRKVDCRKKMKWDSSDFSFIRPVRWLLSLCNNEEFSLQIENIKSSNFTYGHRFLSKGKIVIEKNEDYFKLLKENYVIVDSNLRKQAILSQIKKIEPETEIDENILDINNFLVENPVVFCGKFKSEFLELPEEILISTMKSHQKYFSVYSKNKLTNKFIGVSNISDENGHVLPEVVKGNEKVLTARFEDAKFYYKKDISESIDYFISKLKSVTFIENAGTIYDKLQRIKTLSEKISDVLGLKDKSEILRAAEICKFDLATGVVYEFPHLQGYIGKKYSEYFGEKKEVCEAMQQHYFPLGNINEKLDNLSGNDNLPSNKISSIIAIADKIDTVSVCFSMGLIPTGSSDPYALRRAVRGIILNILKFDFNLSLYELFKFSLNQLNKNNSEILDKIKEFYLLRVKNLYLEENYDSNYVNLSIYDDGILNNIVFKNKINALINLQDKENLDKVMEAFKRIKNIIKKNKITDFKVDDKLFSFDEEIKLYESFIKIKKDIKNYIKIGDYKQIITLISSIGPVINDFFDKVLVMDKDEKIKNNRISFLSEIYNFYLEIYNF